MNPNWVRWIQASFLKHFKDASTGIVTMFVEGMDRSALAEQRSWIEVRVDGPVGHAYSRTYYELDVECNVVISTMRDTKKLYSHDQLIGNVSSWFPHTMSVFKYGTDPIIDDGTLVSCMRLRPILDGDREIRISKFGQVDPNVAMFQSTVEGHYRGEFDA